MMDQISWALGLIGFIYCSMMLYQTAQEIFRRHELTNLELYKMKVLRDDRDKRA